MKGQAVLVKWNPAWYELDQSVVVGDIGLFYFSQDRRCFYNDFIGKNERKIKAEILGITHPELGGVRGIIAIGLCYYIYLGDGNEIIVEAEERPGCIEGSKFAVKEVTEWDFDVQVRMIEEVDLSKKAKPLTPDEAKLYWRERIKRYQCLLEVSDALWAR